MPGKSYGWCISLGWLNPTMSAIASSIEWALRDEGYIMSLCDTHEEAKIQDEYLREMQFELARAVVIIGAVQSELLTDYRNSDTTLLFMICLLRSTKRIATMLASIITKPVLMSQIYFYSMERKTLGSFMHHLTLLLRRNDAEVC